MFATSRVTATCRPAARECGQKPCASEPRYHVVEAIVDRYVVLVEREHGENRYRVEHEFDPELLRKAFLYFARLHRATDAEEEEAEVRTLTLYGY